LSIFFTLASVSILPAIVRADQLVEANSKLALSDSLIGIAGPGIAGGLVQLISAPKAIIIDAVSYLCSALSLRGIAALEAPLQSPARQHTLWREIGEGLNELARTPLLRALTISAGAGSLGGGITQTVSMLFLVRGLEFTPAVIGLALTGGSVGSLLGSLLTGPMTRRVGIGRATILGNGLWVLGGLIVPLAGWLPGPPLLIVGLGQFLSSAGATIFSINQMSLRQHLTPVGLFGRATAARRFFIFGLASVGAAIGGFLGAAAGLRSTLIIGEIVFGLGFLLLFLSPVRYVREWSDSDAPR
jgi:Na+/melibiose symporter-like transporter